MPKFKIIQADPSQFKAEILHFWEKYLPGTPPARLEWMKNNPAGSANWLFAIDEKTGTLAGSISLLPKDLFYNGKKIKAAILGDFMLHKKYRVFGPALNLLKENITKQQAGEYDFLYTVPNEQATKIAQRVGFIPAGELFSMLRPHQCNEFLKKRLGALPAAILGKPLSCFLDCCSRSTYTRGSMYFSEVDWNSSDIDIFFEELRHTKRSIMIGDYSLSYLDWRYRNNPECKFQIITCRKDISEPVEGLFVFSLIHGQVELYDIMSTDDRLIPFILKQISIICKRENCRGIYNLIFEKHPALSLLKKCCFFNVKGHIELLTYPGNIPEIQNWAFTSADRNI